MVALLGWVGLEPTVRGKSDNRTIATVIDWLFNNKPCPSSRIGFCSSNN